MYDWKKVILKSDDTIEQAIDVLNREALGIAMVADNDGRLLGTVTDGDIRRALMRHYGMDGNLVNVMRKNPTSVSVDENPAKVLHIMKRKGLLQVPTLDAEKKIVGLRTLQNLIENRLYENPVFLMAGGIGSRLRPLTNDIPKPLLNVGSKPIMETIIEQFIECGFHNFFVSIHYKAEMVRDYFGDGSRWGVKITYLHEDVPLGTAGALGLIPDNLPDLPILLMNADLLTRVNFNKLLDFHNEQGGIATICIRNYNVKVPYGVIQTDGYRVTGIIEKPVHKLFINAGIYVIDPSISNTMVKRSYIDMPSLLEEHIKKREQINTFPIHEYWRDIGHLKEFEKANQDILDF